MSNVDEDVVENFPAGYCDRERGEIECPLYDKRRHGGEFGDLTILRKFKS